MGDVFKILTRRLCFSQMFKKRFATFVNKPGGVQT